MANPVASNGRAQDDEGGPDPVRPPDGLAYDETTDYRFGEDPNATQAIVATRATDPEYAIEPCDVQDSNGYVGEDGYSEDPVNVHHTNAYLREAGYPEQTGYPERTAYADETVYAGPGRGYGGAPANEGTGAATCEVVIARQEDRFGGIKVGAAFFGWVAASGIAVLLTALVAVTGLAARLLTGPDTMDLSIPASLPPLGMTGIICALLIVFLSFFSGGYVAGRMARFNGVGQGLMVWLWGVIMAGAAAALGVAAGTRLKLSAGSGLAGIPWFEGQVSTGGLIAAIVAATVALMAAVVGGAAGMRYHRRVDRAGFTPLKDEY
jgi:hypothetical protein